MMSFCFNKEVTNFRLLLHLRYSHAWFICERLVCDDTVWRWTSPVTARTAPVWRDEATEFRFIENLVCTCSCSWRPHTVQTGLTVASAELLWTSCCISTSDIVLIWFIISLQFLPVAYRPRASCRLGLSPEWLLSQRRVNLCRTHAHSHFRRTREE